MIQLNRFGIHFLFTALAAFGVASASAFGQNVELMEIPNDQALQAAIHRPAPVCSSIAKQLKLDDRVGLNAYVGADGTVYDTIVSFGNPILVRSVEEAVKQWRFKPFLNGGKPVKAIANLVFELNCKPPKPR
jgi:outer membrane biosynthesis protein TonB